MLAQIKPEKGKYLVQVYRTESITGHKTWQTIAETDDQSLAIRLREYCRYEGHDDEIATLRDFYLSFHIK